MGVYLNTMLRHPNCWLKNVPRVKKELAQIASWYKLNTSNFDKLIKIEGDINKREEFEVFQINDLRLEDWIFKIFEYIVNPSVEVNGKRKHKAWSYRMSCIRDLTEFSKVHVWRRDLYAVSETHKGICGAHQAGINMRWMLLR